MLAIPIHIGNPGGGKPFTRTGVQARGGDKPLMTGPRPVAAAVINPQSGARSGTLAPPCVAESSCSTSTPPIFVDQLKRGRKTATIRLGDKSPQVRTRPGRLGDGRIPPQPAGKDLRRGDRRCRGEEGRELSPRDIEHDNPEFRRLEDEVKFLEQIYGRGISQEDVAHGDPLLADLRAAGRPLRQRRDPPPQLTGWADPHRADPGPNRTPPG